LIQLCENIYPGGAMDDFKLEKIGNSIEKTQDKSGLGRVMALKQIHTLMDSYQRDILVKLALNSVDEHPTSSLICLEEKNKKHLSCQNVSQAKQHRYQLHKIWLAHKPTFKPSNTF
jgi:hypothetical protein